MSAAPQGGPRSPVLLCYDGSPASAIAVAEAGRLLRAPPCIVCHVWSGVSRTVLHANPSDLPGALADAAEELDADDRQAAERTAAEGVELAGRAGLEATALTPRRERKTWRTLCKAADAQDAALMVVGAHGLSGIERVLLGSVANAVAIHAHRPLLVVPAAVTDHAAAGPVVLCYDGSLAARRSIDVIADLLTEPRVLVLNCWSSWAAECVGVARLSRSVRAMAAELDEIAAEGSADTAAEGVRLASEAGLDAEPQSLRTDGPVWPAVRELARSRDAAAVAVGSRGLGGLSRALGSVSNGVLQHSPCAVLMTPQPSP